MKVILDESVPWKLREQLSRIFFANPSSKDTPCDKPIRISTRTGGRMNTLSQPLIFLIFTWLLSKIT